MVCISRLLNRNSKRQYLVKSWEKSEPVVGDTLVVRETNSLSNDGTFWCRPVDEKDCSHLVNRLSELLSKLQLEVLSSSDYEVGKDVFAIKTKQNVFLRAVAETVFPSGQLRVRCIDLGTTEDLKCGHVYRLPDELKLKSPMLQYGKTHTALPMAKWRFKDLTHGQNLKLVIKDKFQADGKPLYFGELLTMGEEATCINGEVKTKMIQHQKEQEEIAAMNKLRQEKPTPETDRESKSKEEEKPANYKETEKLTVGEQDLSQRQKSAESEQPASGENKSKNSGDSKCDAVNEVNSSLERMRPNKIQVKSKPKDEKNKLRENRKDIEFGRLHAILLKPEAQFICILTYPKYLGQCYYSGSFNVIEPAAKTISMYFTSITDSPTYLIFVVSPSTREMPKLSKQTVIGDVGAIGLATSELYDPPEHLRRPGFEMYQDKWVNIEFISTSRTRGCLVHENCCSGGRISKERARYYIDRCMEGITNGTSKPINFNQVEQTLLQGKTHGRGTSNELWYEKAERNAETWDSGIEEKQISGSSLENVADPDNKTNRPLSSQRSVEDHESPGQDEMPVEVDSKHEDETTGFVGEQQPEDGHGKCQTHSEMGSVAHDKLLSTDGTGDSYDDAVGQKDIQATDVQGKTLSNSKASTDENAAKRIPLSGQNCKDDIDGSNESKSTTEHSLNSIEESLKKTLVFITPVKKDFSSLSDWVSPDNTSRQSTNHSSDSISDTALGTHVTSIGNFSTKDIKLDSMKNPNELDASSKAVTDSCEIIAKEASMDIKKTEVSKNNKKEQHQDAGEVKKIAEESEIIALLKDRKFSGTTDDEDREVSQINSVQKLSKTIVEVKKTTSPKGSPTELMDLNKDTPRRASPELTKPRKKVTKTVTMIVKKKVKKSPKGKKEAIIVTEDECKAHILPDKQSPQWYDMAIKGNYESWDTDESVESHNSDDICDVTSPVIAKCHRDILDQIDEEKSNDMTKVNETEKQNAANPVTKQEDGCAKTITANEFKSLENKEVVRSEIEKPTSVDEIHQNSSCEEIADIDSSISEEPATDLKNVEGPERNDSQSVVHSGEVTVPTGTANETSQPNVKTTSSVGDDEEPTGEECTVVEENDTSSNSAHECSIEGPISSDQPNTSEELNRDYKPFDGSNEDHVDPPYDVKANETPQGCRPATMVEIPDDPYDASDASSSVGSKFVQNCAEVHQLLPTDVLQRGDVESNSMKYLGASLAFEESIVEAKIINEQVVYPKEEVLEMKQEENLSLPVDIKLVVPHHHIAPMAENATHLESYNENENTEESIEESVNDKDANSSHLEQSQVAASEVSSQEQSTVSSDRAAEQTSDFSKTADAAQNFLHTNSNHMTATSKRSQKKRKTPKKAPARDGSAGEDSRQHFPGRPEYQRQGSHERRYQATGRGWRDGMQRYNAPHDVRECLSQPTGRGWQDARFNYSHGNRTNQESWANGYESENLRSGSNNDRKKFGKELPPRFSNTRSQFNTGDSVLLDDDRRQKRSDKPPRQMRILRRGEANPNFSQRHPVQTPGYAGQFKQVVSPAASIEGGLDRARDCEVFDLDKELCKEV